MTYLEMLTEANKALGTRTVRVFNRYAYVEGRHESQLGSESWNKSFRLQVQGTIDNQIARAVKSTLKAITPVGVKARTTDPYEEALAAWGTELLEKRREAVLAGLQHAEVSSDQTVLLTDYAPNGDVVIYDVDPRNFYVKTDRAGTKLWAVHFWREVELGPVSATIYLPTETVPFASASTSPLPSAGSFRQSGPPIRNVFGELMLSVVTKPDSPIDRAIPAQNRVNKSLQTQVVVGELYALRPRAWLGLETGINEETGEQLSITSNMNPATGSRDITVPATNTENDEIKVIQFEAPTPGAYLDEQDSDRAVIAGHFSVPSFTLQVKGAQPVSAEALEIAYRDYVDLGDDLRKLYGPWLAEAFRLATRRYLYKVTGQPLQAPDFEIAFKPITTNTLASRMAALESARRAGMTLTDALVEFFGMAREAAEGIEARGLQAEALAQAAAAEADAAAFERGLSPVGE